MERVRARITELLTGARQHRGAVEAALRPLSAVRLHLPFKAGDYVDFYGPSTTRPTSGGSSGPTASR